MSLPSIGGGASGSMSIDKVAFMMDVRNEYYHVLEWFINLLDDHGIQNFKFNDKLFEYSYNVNDGEIVLQFGRSVASQQGRRMRIEFNPNKFDFTNMWYRQLFHLSPKLNLSDITRLDFAIDILDKLNPLYFVDKYKRKNFICHGRAGAETVYLGSPASDCQLKIYNKKLEQKEKFDIDFPGDNWWRVEALCRDLKIFLDSHYSKIKNPFRNLSYVGKDGKVYDSNESGAFMQFFLYYANKEGYQSAIQQITVKEQKSRIKKLVFESAKVDYPGLFDSQIEDVWTGFQSKMGVISQQAYKEVHFTEKDREFFRSKKLEFQTGVPF